MIQAKTIMPGRPGMPVQQIPYNKRSRRTRRKPQSAVLESLPRLAGKNPTNASAPSSRAKKLFYPAAMSGSHIIAHNRNASGCHANRDRNHNLEKFHYNSHHCHGDLGILCLPENGSNAPYFRIMLLTAAIAATREICDRKLQTPRDKDRPTTRF